MCFEFSICKDMRSVCTKWIVSRSYHVCINQCLERRIRDFKIRNLNCVSWIFYLQGYEIGLYQMNIIYKISRALVRSMSDLISFFFSLTVTSRSSIDFCILRISPKTWFLNSLMASLICSFLVIFSSSLWHMT